jgi:hypothetical protein
MDSGWPGFNSHHAQEIFLLSSIQIRSGAYPSSHTMGPRRCFPRGEADHLPPSSAGGKDSGAIPPLSHVFMVCSLSTQATLCLHISASVNFIQHIRWTPY